MKRKTAKLISLGLCILALLMLIVFNDPFQIGFGWKFFLALVLMLVALIIQLTVARCPSCNRLISYDSLIRPYKKCPFCGADLGE